MLKFILCFTLLLSGCASHSLVGDPIRVSANVPYPITLNFLNEARSKLPLVEIEQKKDIAEMLSLAEESINSISYLDRRRCTSAVKAVLHKKNSLITGDRCSTLIYSDQDIASYNKAELMCPVRVYETAPGLGKELLGVMDPDGLSLLALWYFEPC